MKFKPGDLVIKNTGGNKMRILEYKENGMVSCVWATEILNSGVFEEGDLVTLNEYKTSLIVTEKRLDIIKSILE